MINTYEILKNPFLLLLLLPLTFVSVKAGLNNFTDLIFVEGGLIERKVDLSSNEIQCRASIPSHANWFGARVRLGADNELIKPIWISEKNDQLLDSKLDQVKEMLDDCRSGFLFLPDNPYNNQ